MARAGLGLKPLLAMYLLLMLGASSLLIGFAAVRLTRHSLVQERARAQRALLEEAAEQLQRRCPDLEATRTCPYFTEWLGEHRLFRQSVSGLRLVDAQGRLVLGSGSDSAASALWDVFGNRAEDEVVVGAQGQRLLRLEVPAGFSGWQLLGSFSLAEVDREAARLARYVMAYAALILFVVLVVGWLLLYRLVVRPMERMLAVVDRISEGELFPIEERGSELGRLTFSLSRMVNRIESDRQRLKDQIAQLERLNHELHQAQQGLIRSEKLASVGRLAAGLAHEVGNPMSAILGYAGMLQTEAMSAEQQKDILARVEKEAERIDKIIRDLLAYSRPSKGERSTFAPAHLQDEALALLRPQKKFKQIQVEAEVPADLPPIRADFDLARQVLVNLLFNALDAVGDNGHIWVRAAGLVKNQDGQFTWMGTLGEPPFFEQGEIHAVRPPRDGLGLPVDRPVVVFTVVDDGHGIPQEHQNKIFDPFFTTKEPGRGTGLGLAICHSSVSAMGGEIWVFSRPGVGTQLAFYLPAEP